MENNAIRELTLLAWAGEPSKLRHLNAEQREELRQLEEEEFSAAVALAHATAEERVTDRNILRAATQKVVDFRNRFGLDPEGSIA